MDAKVIASIVVALLVVGVFGIHWEDYTSLDASRTLLNGGTRDSRNMMGASTTKQIPIAGNNNAIAEYDVPNATVENMAKTPDFVNANAYSKESGEPVAYRDGASGTSVIISDNKNQPDDATVKSVLETDVASKLPQNTPVKLSEVSRVTSPAAPRVVTVNGAQLIVPSNLTDYQVERQVANSPSLLSAIADAAKRAGKGLLAFAIGDSSSGNVGLVPWGFTSDEVSSLASNGVVKDTVSSTPQQLGMSGSTQSAQDTKAYQAANVDVPSLPSNPGMSLNNLGSGSNIGSGVASGIASFFSGIISFILGLLWGLIKWLLVIALVFIALLFAARYLKEHRHALKKAQQVTGIKELEYDRTKQGSASIKSAGRGSNIINLNPLFRIKVEDNLISRTSPSLQLTLENVSDEDVSDLRISSQSGTVTVIGDIGGGEAVKGKTVRLGAKDVPVGSTFAELSLDFDPLKVGERSFSNFSFRVPLRRIRLASESGKYCWKHPDREATTNCDECGRGLCSDCTLIDDGRVHCSECTGSEDDEKSIREK